MRDFSEALTSPDMAQPRPSEGSFLLRIKDISESGLPRFAAPHGAAQVVLFERLAPSEVGKFAVCKWLAAPSGALGVLAVLSGDDMLGALSGQLAEAKAQTCTATAATQTGTPLVLRHGKACITLHADGRIRLDGEDVGIDAKGPMSLRGATIDLN